MTQQQPPTIGQQQQPMSGQQQRPMSGQQQQQMGSQQQHPMGGEQSQFGTGQADGGQLPHYLRTSLQSVSQAIMVCGWCADQCVKSADPNMVECVRLCEDVVELGETVIATAPRQSRFTPEIVATFQQAAQACAQECGQHTDSHCQECATVLDQTIAATQELRSMGGGQGGATTQHQQTTAASGGQRFQQ